VWSDHKLRDLAPSAVMQLAHQAMEKISTQVLDQALETHPEPAHA
jgi:hypothetical protein